MDWIIRPPRHDLPRIKVGSRHHRALKVILDAGQSGITRNDIAEALGYNDDTTMIGNICGYNGDISINDRPVHKGNLFSRGYVEICTFGSRKGWYRITPQGTIALRDIEPHLGISSEDHSLTVPGEVKQAHKLEPQKTKELPAGVLFILDDEPTQVPMVEVSPLAEWITILLSSPTFAEQKRLGGRAVPANDILTCLLVAIDQRGGKITSSALARAMSLSPMRLRGLLAISQRVLNIDGFPVLTRDEASDTVQLDRPLLLKQFDLSE